MNTKAKAAVGLSAAAALCFMIGFVIGLFPPGDCSASDCDPATADAVELWVKILWAASLPLAVAGGMFYWLDLRDEAEATERAVAPPPEEPAAHEVACTAIGGRNCDYLARGDSVEDVAAQMMAHVEDTHADVIGNATPEQRAALLDQIERVAAT